MNVDMEKLIAMRDSMLEMQLFSDVEIVEETLMFKLRNTAINHFEADNVICHCSLNKDGELTIRYKNGESLIKTAHLQKVKIFTVDPLLEVLYYRKKFHWEKEFTDISKYYYWF